MTSISALEASSLATISTFVENITGHSSSSTDNVPLSTTSDALTPSGPTSTHSPSKDDEDQLSVAYAASEGLVSLLAIFGNALVIYAFCTNRSLRRYRNYYIFSLAIADFLVGLLGIPLAVLASVGLPRNLYGCLFTVSVLMVLCTISILCLVAVSIDRYWATTNPFAYYRHMTTSTSVGIILSCWIVGAVIGFLPLFGWYNLEGWYKEGRCLFRAVIDYNYLVFLYFATIVFPAILMGCFYGYIYHVVLIKIRQKGNLAPQLRRQSEQQSRSGSLNSDNRGSSQILRIIVSEKRREAKAAHKLGIIVLFFMLCWMPLYTFNCIQAFCRNCRFPDELWNFLVILSHANSSLNPLLYAYHLKEFRGAMKNALIMLFGKLCCGLFGDRLQKDGVAGGPISRSQTLPTLSQGTMMTNSSGKFSIQFRRSPQKDVQSSIQISSKQGHETSTSSNFPTNTISDKSSVSLASDISSSILQETHRNPSHSESGRGAVVETSRPRFLEQIRCSSQIEEGTSVYNISHGIEIHIQNIDAEDETEEQTQPKYMQSKPSQVTTTDLDETVQTTNNEIDSNGQ